MKASELMINDWVKFWYFAYKVTEVSIIDDEYAPIQLTSEYEGGACAYSVEPIPITEEILVTNGFVWKLGLWYTHEFDSLGQEFVFNTSCEGSPFVHENNGQIIWHFNFVHELQHALRLCGLKELADNFKIESL